MDSKLDTKYITYGTFLLFGIVGLIMIIKTGTSTLPPLTTEVSNSGIPFMNIMGGIVFSLLIFGPFIILYQKLFP